LAREFFSRKGYNWVGITNQFKKPWFWFKNPLPELGAFLGRFPLIPGIIFLPLVRNYLELFQLFYSENYRELPN